MGIPAIKIQGLSKTIKGKPIIKNLNLEIRSGEVFGLLGPNGAGKTTTIRMIVGLIRMTEGDVFIQGKSINNEYKEAIREVGAIVENPEMYPFMTGKENLIHFARMVPGIDEDRIQRIIALVGLEHAMDEKVGKYSLGMRQRLGIAQALLHRPSILILDEPTNGLDPAGIREIRHYIRNLAKEEEVAVIISSHLLGEIELMCDRIGVINKGELIAIQEIRGSGKDSGPQEIQMEVKPVKKAIKLLKQQHGVESELTEGLVSFELKKESIPEVIQTLVKNGISIYEVRVAQSTLEEQFFDLIGENVVG